MNPSTEGKKYTKGTSRKVKNIQKELDGIHFHLVLKNTLPPTKYRNPKTDKELIVTLISFIYFWVEPWVHQ